jgi:predicted secreted protein
MGNPNTERFYLFLPSFSTAGGNLTLAYDNSVGIASTITAVPEPEEWAMMLVGSGLISWQLRRRAKAAA